ncbi:uncharacterized protein F5147DRAFT_724479 [Suillus discolor]|uniref:Dienelactone hydrolase domain-containing protein n=1 Tax=Suillus discolor TaxID=1912936 RepID=A0A9P7JMW5_9AGAM|nr:uncharacterized protein F5147DRAFT_724479 [Suillus discolor]KAG2090775.1 hypothetical protein F5147DRAFT_724479 [Suillus discolor]
MSSTLAGPLTDHCFTSVAHSGTLKGESITIAGVPTYLSAPQASVASTVETVILASFCVYSFLVCVLIRKAGFTVVGIDYFFGDPVHLHLNKPGSDRSTWRTKSIEQARASVPKWVDGVKEMFGTILDHPSQHTVLHSYHPIETDSAFPATFRRHVEDILVEKRATYYFQIFSGVSHGFGTRGDPEIETERWAKEECQRAMVGWFKRFTSSK